MICFARARSPPALTAVPMPTNWTAISIVCSTMLAPSIGTRMWNVVGISAGPVFPLDEQRVWRRASYPILRMAQYSWRTSSGVRHALRTDTQFPRSGRRLSAPDQRDQRGDRRLCDAPCQGARSQGRKSSDGDGTQGRNDDRTTRVMPTRDYGSARG